MGGTEVIITEKLTEEQRLNLLKRLKKALEQTDDYYKRENLKNLIATVESL